MYLNVYTHMRHVHFIYVILGQTVIQFFAITFFLLFGAGGDVMVPCSRNTVRSSVRVCIYMPAYHHLRLYHRLT